MTKPFKPFLATDADLDKVKYPVMVMNKIDGCRMLIRDGKATGRSLKTYKNKIMTSYYSEQVFSGFDGELAYGDITSQSLCRDTTSVVNTIASDKIPKLYVFDYITEETKDLPYLERWLMASRKITGFQEVYMESMIEVVPYTMAYSKEEVEALYHKALLEGYEGIILRDPNANYKYGRCTVNEAAYLRMKPSEDAEAIVLEVVEAMENLNEAVINELGHTERSSHKANKVGKGMAGMFICKDLKTGNIINVSAGKMSHEDRKYYYENPDKIVGQIIKYRSLMTGVKDAPRHLRFIGFRAEEDMSE